jgi:site-specific recombinase XerD
MLHELALRLVDTQLEGNRITVGHRKRVKHHILRFFSWMKSQDIEDIRKIGKIQLTSYYKYICCLRSTKGTRTIGEPLSARTVNGYINAVKKMFTVLYRSGYLAEDVFSDMDMDLRSKGGFKRRPFTEEEITEFLERITPVTKIGLRDRALYELIYSSGLRVSEAARLTMGDIDLEKREVIVHGKGNRDRLVPISFVARDFLRLYIGERINRLDEAVFLGTNAKGKGKPIRPQTITCRFRELLVKFDMDGMGRCAHAVRHSTATHLLDHGASIRHIQELLGHKNIDTTVRYTQVQTAGLQKVYRKYHPGEHELFETVDEEYELRLISLVEGKGELC